MQLSHKYEVERMALKSKITALRKKLSESGKQQQQRESFILAVRRFMQMDYLTAPLLRELIDHIDVFETEGLCGDPGSAEASALQSGYPPRSRCRIPHRAENSITKRSRPLACSLHQIVSE